MSKQDLTAKCLF